MARTAIKSQVLADFIADWTPSQGDKMNEDRPDTPWSCIMMELIVMMETHLQQSYCHHQA
jgi:hypothetical protein